MQRSLTLGIAAAATYYHSRKYKVRIRTVGPWQLAAGAVALPLTNRTTSGSRPRPPAADSRFLYVLPYLSMESYLSTYGRVDLDPGSDTIRKNARQP